MSKYTRAEQSLVRALMHDYAVARPLNALPPVPQSYPVQQPNSGRWFWRLIPLFAIACPFSIPLFAIGVEFFGKVPEGSRAGLIFSLALLFTVVVLAFTVLPSLVAAASRFNFRFGGRQWAEDKVDSLMSMAALPWKIERTALPNQMVEYRLIVPPDTRESFAGSPTIVMSSHAAEKADLLILSIKEDSRLLEKWSNNSTVAPSR